MPIHSGSRILELEKIAEGAREQLETIALRTDNLNADIERLVESNENDEEIEKLKEQLSSLKLTSHGVRRSLTDAELRKKCLLKNKEMKRQDMVKLQPRVDNNNGVTQPEFQHNEKSFEVPIISNENKNQDMSVVGKPNNAIENSFGSEGDNSQKTLNVKVDDGDDNAHVSVMNNVRDANENLGTIIKWSDEKKGGPSPQESSLLSNITGVETRASSESQCRNENGDVLRCKGDSREASCIDGKNRRSVKWVQRMVDINKDESVEDARNENHRNPGTQLTSEEVCNDAGTGTIKLRDANKLVGDNVGVEGKKNLGTTARSANERLCKKASANDNLNSELKPDTKNKDTDSSSVGEMRKKMREPVMYKPKLDRSLFQKSKLDPSPVEEVNKTTEPIEEKCICLRPLKMILCECGNCFIGRLRKKCPVHPSDLYLLDVDQCKMCKSYFPREYDMTEEQSQETYRNPLISGGKF